MEGEDRGREGEGGRVGVIHGGIKGRREGGRSEGGIEGGSHGRRGRTGGRDDGREGGGREERRVLDTRALHNAQVQAWLCT